MANAEHLRILKKGVEAWNEWRQQNPSIRPDLEGGDLSNRFFDEISLSNSNLISANFSGSSLIKATLMGAEMQHANLSNAVLSNAVLSGAILIEAILSKAGLNKADLLNVMLMNSDLTEADLVRADFTMANLSGANFYSARMGLTILSDTNLANARNLDTVTHIWPSAIDHQTIFRSGYLSMAFLRGCGLPESLIEYYPSLLNNPLQFYKCFISFTEIDDLFSKRIYNDLQAKGVSCWRWKEDAKTGQILLRSIDEAIKVYDKLIVICSRDSLQSPAVIREIERALQKEDNLSREGKDAEVLFPIRVDDYIRLYPQ